MNIFHATADDRNPSPADAPPDMEPDGGAPYWPFEEDRQWWATELARLDDEDEDAEWSRECSSASEAIGHALKITDEDVMRCGACG